MRPTEKASTSSRGSGGQQRRGVRHLNYETHANNAFIDHRRGWGELALDYLFGCCGVVWGAEAQRTQADDVGAASPTTSTGRTSTSRQAWYERSVKAWLALGAGLGIGAGIQIVFEQLRRMPSR